MPTTEADSTEADSSSNDHSATTAAATNGTDSPQPLPIPRIRTPTSANGFRGTSPRDPHRNNDRDARSPVGSNMPSPPPSSVIEIRNPPCQGNFGNHPRGDRARHNNTHGFLGRPDRGNYAPNIRQQRVSIISPPPLSPFPNLPEYPGFVYVPTSQMEPFGGIPFLTNPPPLAIFFPRGKVEEILLPDAIIKQIDYYFSDANLVNDEFLKSNMDEQGWVPIDLVANFPKVKSLTKDTDLILDSLRNSSTVEVQDKKLRRRYMWRNWLSPARNDSASTSS